LAEHGPDGVVYADIDATTLAGLTDLYLEYGAVAVEEMERQLRSEVRRQAVIMASVQLLQTAKNSGDYGAGIEAVLDASRSFRVSGSVNARSAAESAIQRWQDERDGKRRKPVTINDDPSFPVFAGGGHYILAARTAVGKTALALQWGLQAARNGHKVVLYSMEMPLWSIGARLISQVTGYPVHTLSKHEDLTAALEQLDVPLMIHDDIDHAEAIYAHMRSAHADLYIVDYLGLVVSAHREERRELEVARISHSLKRLAVKLDRPVLTLAQINRQAETKKDRRPELAQLRDSGSIEQDADAVMLLWRKPDSYGTPTAEGEIVVAKNRQGPTRPWPLHFEGSAMTFKIGWEAKL